MPRSDVEMAPEVPLPAHMWLGPVLISEISRGASSILDIGFGHAGLDYMITRLMPNVRLGGMDLWKPYVDEATKLLVFDSVILRDAGDAPCLSAWTSSTLQCAWIA